ncbi:SDR family oxidoreductase [Saccharomonospora azurea]|uniref:Short-chain alcohol dehydrogenase like protein n=1 Tax=Saccharomonospora azurea NA-128 TaxID=882081 RepID=H8G665_9PSEU|nr:SDR family oxidoreductase [Saccharomonospora azurea]EHK88636.1 3-oxoacyl-[acyl-carrier-protein] reductase [Saccharomonospora azurea SZMC 14600]EHY87225.1 hypothetical protein SacazDRAFT_00238 [Saccharomonospora azurea NA-128]
MAGANTAPTRQTANITSTSSTWFTTPEIQIGELDPGFRASGRAGDVGCGDHHRGRAVGDERAVRAPQRVGDERVAVRHRVTEVDAEVLGITCNSVAPGPIATALTRDVTYALDDQVIKRMGTPEEVGAAVAYLASPGAAYVTGQVLSVCGGAAMG